MRWTLPLLVLGLSPAALAAPKTPVGGKAAPACGVKVLPFVPEASWTYQNMMSPVPADEKLAKLSPTPVKQVVIKVKSIETKGADTVVTLEETISVEITTPAVNGKGGGTKVDERKLTTNVVCNDKAKKFEISPDSFLFAGEPGGFLNMTFDKIDRPKSASASGMVFTNGTIGEGEFREDVVAHWVRKPTEGTSLKATSGKLELERKFVPQNPEQIIAKAGSWKAEKLGLTTTGRITLDQAHPENKPMELPAGWTTQMWLVDGVGLVQSINGYSHMYQLVDYSPK